MQIIWENYTENILTKIREIGKKEKKITTTTTTATRKIVINTKKL